MYGLIRDLIFTSNSSNFHARFRAETAYLLSQDGLRRPIVDPARHATFLQ